MGHHKQTENQMGNDLIEWLKRISGSEMPPSNVIAYNIGIFETPDGYSVYLIGSDNYTPDDSDWACDEVFSPKERYFAIPNEDRDWEKILSEVVTAIKIFVESPDVKTSYLSQAKFLTVGFDDGDLVRIR